MICEPVNIDGSLDVKRCTKCDEIKQKIEFNKCSKNKSGITGQCKSCIKSYHDNRKNLSKTLIENKKCDNCNEIKHASEFNKNCNATDGLCKQCKICQSRIRSNTKNKNKTVVEIKTCASCGCVKSVSDFTINNSSVDGLDYNCKNCKSNYRKKFKHLSRVYQANRRAANLTATPSWVDEEEINKVNLKHDDAWWITQLTGVEHHVDHVHPLRGKNFSGLHTSWNLQVMVGAENLKKRNNPPPEEHEMFWHFTMKELEKAYAVK